MGQFKPMVKRETTEPSVELKLKKGGRVAMAKGGTMETAVHERNERQEVKRVEKELKGHARQAASKAHKGLATGGVVNGQTGYKMGGAIPKSGIIKSEKGRATMADGANPKQFKGPTGVVKKGAPAGFKTGGKAVKGCKY